MARPPVPPSPPGSLLDLLEAALAAQGERLRDLGARARAGGDDELVHDVRVALRRVEALARLFRGVPGKGDGDDARARARALRRRLSLLRSDEVGRALLAARAPADDGALLARVFPEALPDTRVDASELSAVERSLAAWRRGLAAAFDGPFAPRASGAARLGRKLRRRLRGRVRELSALLPPRARTLHAARIAAKRLRYALEVVEAIDPSIRPALRLLRSFQEAAGDAHDLVELAARVAAAAPGDPALEALRLGLEAEASRAVAAARRRGAALVRPVGSLRPARDAVG